MSDTITRCSEAITVIDKYLHTNQKDSSYIAWLDRYSKKPHEHDDFFLFGMLVQAMFSGGMKGKTVDAWMPKMKKAFFKWDFNRIASISPKELTKITNSGQVIKNKSKLNAVVTNARTVLSLSEKHKSFGNYLTSFKSVRHLSDDIQKHFVYLKEITTEDFLRNAGFDTLKPDLHVTRWLCRMGAIDEGTPAQKTLEMCSEIASKTGFKKPRVDAVIYLFCADRDTVIEHGICENNPRCDICPIVNLCPQYINVKTKEPSKKSPKSTKTIKVEKQKYRPDTVWETCYKNMSYEKIESINPFITEGWLNEPYGKDGSRERYPDIVKLFNRKKSIDLSRIKELGRNKGKYAAFRAIVHQHAVWEDGKLHRRR